MGADFGGMTVGWGFEAAIVLGMAVLGVLILPGVKRRPRSLPRLGRRDEAALPDATALRARRRRSAWFEPTSPPLTLDPVDWTGRSTEP